MAKTTDKQLTLTVDVDAIFATFLDKAGWVGADLDEESKRIGDAIGAWKDQIEALQVKVAAAEKEMATLGDREKVAKAFLIDAATQMGKFANEAVLLTAMQEEFPSAKPRRGRKAGQSVGRVKVSAEEVTQVLESLDKEGKGVSAIGKETAIDSKRVAIVLKKLVSAGHVRTSGERRGMMYHLVGDVDVEAVAIAVAAS